MCTFVTPSCCNYGTDLPEIWNGNIYSFNTLTAFYSGEIHGLRGMNKKEEDSFDWALEGVKEKLV